MTTVASVESCASVTTASMPSEARARQCNSPAGHRALTPTWPASARVGAQPSDPAQLGRVRRFGTGGRWPETWGELRQGRYDVVPVPPVWAEVYRAATWSGVRLLAKMLIPSIIPV